MNVDAAPDNSSSDGSSESSPDGSSDGSFWDSPLPRDECDALGLHVPWPAADSGTPLDDDDAPALRGIGRPAAWKVPAPPESVLATQYTSAGRRAAELLCQALSTERGSSSPRR